MPANRSAHEHTPLPRERDLLPRSLDGTDLVPLRCSAWPEGGCRGCEAADPADRAHGDLPGAGTGATLGRGPTFALGVLDKISQVFEPLFDVKETADTFMVMTDLPGLKESQLDVEVCDGRLTITGEREQDDLEEGACYYAMDRRFGTFCLAFQLPSGVDGNEVQARLDNGVLTVNVPKPSAGPVSRVAVTRGN
jgi:HSP20 family protein